MKNKITFEEHEVMGIISKMLNDKLVSMRVEKSNQAKTKKEGAIITGHILKANKHLSEFKNHMEEVMFKDYPKQSNTDVYYGDRDKNGDIIKCLRNHLNKTDKKLIETKEQQTNIPQSLYENIKQNYNASIKILKELEKGKNEPQRTS